MKIQIIKMPKISTFNKSTLAIWKKEVGDTVRKGESLFEVEYGKSSMVVRSTYTGTLKKIIVSEGETVSVDSPVAYIMEE